MWIEHVAQTDKIRNKYRASVQNFFEQSLGRELGKSLVSFSRISELKELKPPLLLPQH
jgi:hypothetical protein